MTNISNDEILGSIRHLSEDHGVPPTYREIADDLGVQVSLVHRRLHQLREDGAVTFRDQLSRTVRVLERRA
jgi:DNA-binding transcriptional regulator YhcF (GntR family)